MLNGKALGKAINAAISLKIASGAIKSKADVARHFNIRPPSVEGWIKTGAIAKHRLPQLWLYFQDVVGPEHWGLDPSLTRFTGVAIQDAMSKPSAAWPFVFAKYEDYLRLDTSQQQELDRMIAWFLAGARKTSSQYKTHPDQA